MGQIDPDEFKALRSEVRDMRGDIKDLLDTWRAAQGAVRMVRVVGNVAKWIAGVAASVAGLWALLKWGFGK